MKWTNTSPIISKLTDMIKKKWTRFGSQKQNHRMRWFCRRYKLDIAEEINDILHSSLHCLYEY